MSRPSITCNDRMSFTRFLRLGFEDSIPEATSEVGAGPESNPRQLTPKLPQSSVPAVNASRLAFKERIRARTFQHSGLRRYWQNRLRTDTHPGSQSVLTPHG
jgi:hypothetical protein